MMKPEELQALGLDPDAAATVLAHWESELAGERSAREETEKRMLVREALQGKGADAASARLLLREVDLSRVTVADGRITADDGQVNRLAEDYAGLFAHAKPLTRVTPPRAAASAMDRSALEKMSLEEINDHWREVRDALAR